MVNIFPCCAFFQALCVFGGDMLQACRVAGKVRLAPQRLPSAARLPGNLGRLRPQLLFVIMRTGNHLSPRI
jgi:hypothetical protein